VNLPDAEPWMQDALCAQTDPDLFFPERGQPAEPARRICGSCPVAAKCLEYALRNEIWYGVWGGLAERQRRRLLRESAA
jgi:WhiB family redox-sensing transcriptional regulator